MLVYGFDDEAEEFSCSLGLSEKSSFESAIVALKANTFVISDRVPFNKHGIKLCAKPLGVKCHLLDFYAINHCPMGCASK